MPTDTLSVTDNRTGREFEIQIMDGSIRATSCAGSRWTRRTSA